MRKCACDVWKFIFLATVDEKIQNADVTAAAEHFSLFEREGATEYPQYRIPGYVLRFADKVLASKCPLQLARELWTFARTPVLKQKKAA